MNPFDPVAKLCWHGDRVKDWLDGKPIAPILVEIDPVNYCNAKCPWCVCGDRSNRARFVELSEINPESLHTAISDMYAIGVKAINWTGSGEPTLYPHLDKMTRRAHEFGIRQGLFTNAISKKHGVDASLFDWIRVSLTEQYIEGISKPLLAEYVLLTKVGITMNITSGNAHLVDEMCRESKALGVNYFQVRPALQQSYETQEEIEVPISLKQYEDADFKVYLSPYKFSDYRRPKSYSMCRAGQFECVLDCRGNVRVCNYHLDEPKYAVGSIYEESFADIVERIPRETTVAANCQTTCKNHEINKCLDQLLQLENVDFL